jgi:uncharacterized protein YbaA (DUF1428 family)
MAYVDGFLLAVSEKNIAESRRGQAKFGRSTEHLNTASASVKT